MAPRIRYVVNHYSRQVSVGLAGDERHTTPVPRGWEEIALDSLAPDVRRRFDLAGDTRARLKALRQPGYEVHEPANGWCSNDELERVARGRWRLFVFGLIVALIGGAIALWMQHR